METWRYIWRKGIVQVMTIAELKALRDGLEVDSVRIVQGVTTNPKCYPGGENKQCESCCPVSYGAWVGNRLQTVFDVEERFAAIVNGASKLLPESYTVAEFFYWFDHNDRSDVVTVLLSEVRLYLGAYH